MSWIWTGITALSLLSAFYLGNGSKLAGAIPMGAQAGVELAIAMSGSICLWTGVGALMDKAGMTQFLSKILQPILYKVFPGSRTDAVLRNHLSANICANFLGLGNAATPMGIQAVQRMVDPSRPGLATDQMCRLIVLNTASIQLIPANVAAVRAGLGCPTPFDILPAVWITSVCSAGLGLIAAWLLGRIWWHE